MYMKNDETNFILTCFFIFFFYVLCEEEEGEKEDRQSKKTLSLLLGSLKKPRFASKRKIFKNK